MLPPRKEQDKIAAILSAYDDLIANNQRRIALLEGMAEESYREWFVRIRFPGWERSDVSPVYGLALHTSSPQLGLAISNFSDDSRQQTLVIDQ